MDKRQIKLVEQTFAQIAARGDPVVDVFYSELRGFDPKLGELVASGLAAQRRTLLTTIETIVSHLGQPRRILEPAQKLAVRSLVFSTLSQQTSFVGNALLRTLKRELGAGYTDDVRDAWISAYRLVADAMREAAFTGGARQVA